MKTLFNKYESYNKVGGLVSIEIQEAVSPIMRKWAKKGYSVKNIESIIIDNVGMESTLIRAEKAIQMRKKIT